MDHIACTSAPFDGVPEYTEEQKPYFGTVEDSEKLFTEFFGEEIPSDYLEKLSKMLNDIATWISHTTETSTRGFKATVFYAILTYTILPEEEDLVQVRNINTRPCFARHHFALVFWYWLINRCVQYNKRLIVCRPLETTISLFNKYFPAMFEKHDENYEYIKNSTPPIPVENRFTIAGDEITLNGFPTARELNSSKYVEEHNKRRRLQ